MKKCMMMLCLSVMLISGMVSSVHANSVEAEFFFDGVDLDTGTVDYDRTILVILMGDTIEELLRPDREYLADFSPSVDVNFEWDPAEANLFDLILQDDVKITVLKDTSFDTVKGIMPGEFEFSAEPYSVSISSDDLVLAWTAEDRSYKLGEFQWSDWTMQFEFEELNSIPEPSTFLLFGLGLVGVAALVRRKKNIAAMLAIMMFASLWSAEIANAQPGSLITIKKEGPGNGTILVGDQECDIACVEMSVPYVDHRAVILKVVPDEDSYFVRWETADGSSSEETLSVQPGDTVIAIFDKKFGSTAVFDYDFWRETFSIPVSPLKSIPVNQVFSADEEFDPFLEDEPLYGVAINADIQLENEASLVRVVLVDDQANEYLLYEAYPLISPETSFSIKKTCEETWFVDAVTPDSIKIQVIDASITIHELLIDEVPKRISGETAIAVVQQIKDAQETVKIETLNAQIQQQGLQWMAGETSVSSMSYQQKNGLFKGEYLPNLQGFEYYTGGIFELRSPGSASPVPSGPSALVETFDWRNRHGENWMTPVKDQAECGSCWAFAATGATEALVNLYFNQHLDLDLAEQDALSCSGAGTCKGGLPGETLDYYTNTGVVDEACFPYTAVDANGCYYDASNKYKCDKNPVPCSNRCTNPDELIQISGKITFGSSGYPKTENTLKKMIIEYGPVSGGIYSWKHAMTLVGYSKDSYDGKTVWIFKNSWGTWWGENGYVHLKVEMSNIGWTHALQHPVISATPQQISCVDNDSDGYCNWGISTDKPSSCPSFCKPEKDCDDSNPYLGPFSSEGQCLSNIPIILYDAGGTYSVPDRPYGDNLCSNSPNKPAGYSNFRVFISAGDAIQDIATTYDIPISFPITGPTGTKIADNWADLFDGDIDTSLQDAGILPPSTQWWSGLGSCSSVYASSIDSSQVVGSFISDYDTMGALGNSWDTTSNWLWDNLGADCSAMHHILCIASPAPDACQVTTENDSGDGSLRQVLADAESNGCRRIRFAPGVSTITLSSQLEIPSATLTIDGGPSGVIISGSNSTRVFYVGSEAKVTFQNLTITNGQSLDGGGIYIDGGEVIVGNGTTISSNTADFGGGIANPWGTVTIASGGKVIGNTANQWGGGIYNEAGQATVDGTVINNTANQGGGVFNDGSLTVNGTISGNMATYAGGGIFNDNGGGEVTIESEGMVSDNTADQGGGIYHNGGVGSDMITVNGVVKNNTATNNGGGIYNTGTLTIVNSATVTENTANKYGGGIYNQSGENTITVNGMIVNNTATAGGGIYNDQGTITGYPYYGSGNTPNNCSGPGGCPPPPDLCQVRYESNSGPGSLRWVLANATSNGCETIGFAPEVSTINLGWDLVIPSGTVAIDGGASGVTVNGNSSSRVFRVGEEANVTFRNLTITGGREAEGAGISNEGTITIGDGTTISGNSAGEGGGIVNWGGMVTIENGALIRDNDGERGGGIYNTGTLIIDGKINGNTAKEGGGIYNRKGTVIVNGTIDGNTAPSGYAIYNIQLGGGIFNTGGKVTINGTVANNTAGSQGGGIYNSGELTVNGTVKGNTASHAYYYRGDGGGIYNTGTLTIASSARIIDNTAEVYGGGIHTGSVQGSVATFQNGSLVENNTAAYGGGIYSMGMIIGTPNYGRGNTPDNCDGSGCP